VVEISADAIEYLAIAPRTFAAAAAACEVAAWFEAAVAEMLIGKSRASGATFTEPVACTSMK
jgi:hypothetical protein